MVSRDSSTDIKRPGFFAKYLLLLFVVVFFSGCLAEKTVRYIPPSERKTFNRPTNTPVNRTAVLLELEKFYSTWKGTRYRQGGMSRKGVDCSGLTVLLYKQVYKINLPRTVKEQAGKGRNVAQERLQSGDLVFFKTGLFSRHVGVYLHDNSFMHASLSQGVMKSDLNDDYWRKRFWRARRL